jgi:hypothetical protein
MKNYKLKIKKVGFTLSLLHFAFCIFNCSATPFFFQGYLHDGSPQTNLIYMTQYPATTAPFTVYGTNIIYGADAIVITPNASGYSSNWSYPGTFRFYITNLNVSFIANIPDTATFQSLALYVTNVTGFSGVGLNSYGVVTNLIGFPPATNTTSGIVAALGFTPATNTYNGITNSLGFAPPTNNYTGLTNALGLAPATNNSTGIIFALGYTPATNSYNGVTNSLGFSPATNSNAGITAAQGFASATNSTAGITAALHYTPRTNDGNVGLISVASFATNGFSVWISYPTNNVPGPAYTNAPPGSLLTTTNGAFFVLTNLNWVAK